MNKLLLGNVAIVKRAARVTALLFVMGSCPACNNEPAKAPPPAAPSPTVATSAAAATGAAPVAPSEPTAPVEPPAPAEPAKVRMTLAEMKLAYAEVFANPFERAKKFDVFIAKVGAPEESKGKHDTVEGGEWAWYALDDTGDCRHVTLKFGDVGDVGLMEYGSMSGDFKAKCE